MKLTKAIKAKRAVEFKQAQARRIEQAEYKAQLAANAKQREIDNQITSYQRFKDLGSKPVINARVECSAGQILTSLS
jgi:hypothetical protein